MNSQMLSGAHHVAFTLSVKHFIQAAAAPVVWRTAAVRFLPLGGIHQLYTRFFGQIDRCDRGGRMIG